MQNRQLSSLVTDVQSERVYTCGLNWPNKLQSCRCRCGVRRAEPHAASKLATLSLPGKSYGSVLPASLCKNYGGS